MDRRWKAWFYVLKLESELNTGLDWLVMRNFFSRSDISSNFSVLVPKRICRTSAVKAKTANYILRPYFSFTGSACRCAKNVHCSQCQTTLTFTATRLLIWRRKVLNVLLFLFKMHTIRITARFVTCSFPSSRIPGRPRTSACFCAKARLIRVTSLLGFGGLKTYLQAWEIIVSNSKRKISSSSLRKTTGQTRNWPK